MMTFQQLSTLIKNGYSEDQIKQLNAIFSPEPNGPAPNGGTATQYGPVPTTTPNPSPAPAPAPDQPQTQPAPGTNTPSPTPAPESPTQPQQVQQPEPESETQKMLKEMLGIMRTGAINNLQQPTQPQVTTESILAKVLEP